MTKPAQFFLNSKEITFQEAEMHFLNWALALNQENNDLLLWVCDNDRCALNARSVFQVAVYPRGNVNMSMFVNCDILVAQSGLFVKRFR